MDVQKAPLSESFWARALDRLFEALCSLKLAVVVILGFAGSLATGTILESLYDTPTAQYFVYRSLWFHALLATLGVNIFCVAISRWPWKRGHIPFLLAHLGILMLLAGSWATEKFGLDGSVRVSEGEAVNTVEMDDNSLILSDAHDVHKIPIRWIPPGVEFKPIRLKDRGLDYDLVIDKFLSHADPVFTFIPNAQPRADHPPLAAVQLRLQGGPMNITQDFWMWMGDASFRNLSMGPANFSIGPGAPPAQPGHPSFNVLPGKTGGIAYQATSSEGKVVQGEFVAKDAKGQLILPGWKGNVRLTILDWVPDASPLTHYSSARVQYGQQAPQAAIHVVAGPGGPGAETWLGIGDRAALHTASGDVELTYMPQRVALPFAVRLDRFQIDRYEGSMDPASYSSKVTIFDDRKQNSPPREGIVISMNEPLTVQGITLYQSSYEDAQPRPTVSIFSVNHDPGRIWKYLGSLLIVGGAILLFGVKYWKAYASKKDPGLEAQKA